MPAPVTAVIPVQEPDEEALRRTLDSLAMQETPPAELIVVDASPERAVDLPPLPFEARVDHRPGLADAGRTIPLQRRLGLQQASQPIAWRLDEDAVFDRRDHLARLLEDLDRPGVVAACSRVRALNDSAAGNLMAALMELHPVYGLFPVYYLEDLPPGEAYPRDTTAPFSVRASDVTFVRQVLKRGDLHRNDDLVARTTLPMTRTKYIMQGAAAAGGIAALVGGR